MERLQSAPAIQFKGSGWYVTDYAGKPSAKESGSTDSPAASAAADKNDSAAKDSTTKETSPKETKETKETKEKKPATKK